MEDFTNFESSKDKDRRHNELAKAGVGVIVLLAGGFSCICSIVFTLRKFFDAFGFTSIPNLSERVGVVMLGILAVLATGVIAGIGAHLYNDNA